MEEDKEALSRMVEALGENSSPLKDASAWLAQKLSRIKLTMGESFGLFEAVELMSLGVAGKIALWKCLTTVPAFDGKLNTAELEALINRATRQFDQLESSRLRLSEQAFG